MGVQQDRDAWRELARRERIYTTVIYGFVPVVAVVLVVASLFAGDVPRWFGVGAGASGIAAFFLSSAHLLRFRCPKCGHEYCDPMAGPGPECAHCHTRRGSDQSLPTPPFESKSA